MDPITLIIIIGSIIGLINSYRLVCSDRRRKARRELSQLAGRATREAAHEFGIIEAVALADRIARPGTNVLRNVWGIELPDEGNAWLISQLLLSDPAQYRSLLASTAQFEVAETARIAKQKRDDKKKSDTRRLNDFVEALIQGTVRSASANHRELARDRNRLHEDISSLYDHKRDMQRGGPFVTARSMEILESKIEDRLHRIRSYERQLTTVMENLQIARDKEIAASVRVHKDGDPPDYEAVMSWGSPQMLRMVTVPPDLSRVDDSQPHPQPLRFERPRPIDVDQLAGKLNRPSPAWIQKEAYSRDTGDGSTWRRDRAKNLRHKLDHDKITRNQYRTQMQHLYEHPEF